VTENGQSTVMLVTELAEAAGVSVVNIRKLLLKGTLKGRKHGGVWVIPLEEANRYLEKRQGRKRAFFHRRRSEDTE
jgi:predicted site-specific integrase-resolvase